MSRLAKGYLIASVGIVFWSTTGVFMGYLLAHYPLPALVLAFWRNLLVCGALAPALFFFRRPLLAIGQGQLKFYIFYGFVLAVFNSIWALSVRENGAAVATVLAYSSAGFTAIIAFFVFREKLGLPKIVALGLSVVGCVLVAEAYRLEAWHLNFLGIATGLLTGVLFAVYTLLGKEVSRRQMNIWTALLYSFAFGSGFILLFNLFPELPGAAGSLGALLPALPSEGWLLLLCLAVGPTLLGFGLYNASMNYLPASIANLLATTEPALTAVEAYIFLHERLTGAQIVGGVILLLAVLIVQLEKG